VTAVGRPYRLFEVTGLELEYPVVGRDLAVRPLVEAAFRRLRGRPASDVELPRFGFSNELAAHVFELKTPRPLADLVEIEADLAAGVRRFSDLLSEFDARLLPTGMHPFMRPSETTLWRRSGGEIYRAYARLFDLRGHGWLNVQACHVNLPFGSEEETVRLHNAIALLIPYLPALAASSPLVEGRLGPHVDNRLAFYRGNQARLPRIAGDVVPEPMTSFRQYRREVLRPIYRDLAALPGAERLRHEWVNSRGAILRFMRRAIEIRVLDVQECVQMDVAIAAFVRGVAKALVRRLGATGDGEPGLPEHGLLVEDFGRTIEKGSAARVAAPHLRALPGGVGSGGGGGSKSRRIPAGELLAGLLDAARAETPKRERPYLDLVAHRLAGGSLAERIRRRVAAVPARRREPAIRALYEELAGCLVANSPWPG
jgi:gamma-glutamyl:cysteine ligase YbdK (ATP-grasp superfamily)